VSVSQGKPGFVGDAHNRAHITWLFDDNVDLSLAEAGFE
jgi:hypothetical protein